MKPFALLQLLSIAVAQVFESEYMSHMAKHGRSLASVEEYNTRLGAYMRSDAKIKETNASQNSFRLGHNKFSDWTDEEMASVFGRPNHEKEVLQEEIITEPIKLTGSTSDAWDWRNFKDY